MSEIRTDAAAWSDSGMIRPNNEDGYFLAPQGDLFIVADGMGGHAGGETASQTIIEVATAAAADTARWQDPAKELTALLHGADAEVRVKAIGPLANMGSTVVALFLREGNYWVAHAGDSRAYLLRDGQLRRLTTDHTPEQECGYGEQLGFRSGMITRAVGIGPITQFDVTSGPLQAGDRFLLCSDGLTDMVSETRLKEILTAAPAPADAARNLIDAANASGGRDNITAIIVNFI